jgi:hypothetical protein
LTVATGADRLAYQKADAAFAFQPDGGSTMTFLPITAMGVCLYNFAAELKPICRRNVLSARPVVQRPLAGL